MQDPDPMCTDLLNLNGVDPAIWKTASCRVKSSSAHLPSSTPLLTANSVEAQRNISLVELAYITFGIFLISSYFARTAVTTQLWFHLLEDRL